jgi:exopolysaccharide biosynthesis polyprenyl glycosylphosphotransferase
MKYPRYKIILAIIDYLLIRMAFSVALQLRGISQVTGEVWWDYVQSPDFIFFFFYSLFIVVLFRSNSLYKIDTFLTKSKQTVSIFISFFYAIIGLAVINYFIRSPWIIDSRLAVAFFSILGFFSIAGYRLLIFRPLFMYLGRKQILQKNILIVGTNLEARNLAVQLSVNNIYGLNLIGFVDNHLPVGSRVFEYYENLGRFKDIPVLVEKKEIKEIIISVSDVSNAQLLHIIDICKKSSAQVRVTSTLFDIIHKKILPEAYFNVPLADLTSSGASQGRLILKRVTDIVLSAFALLCLSPFLLIIAALVKCTSKGPVFYKQMRIGKDGNEFYMYKFRSMVMNSDNDHERLLKVKEFIQNGKSNGNGSTKIVNTERVTAIGYFIRKTSIDELPQLFNVLKGEMSLVGPRPCLPYEYDVYDDWHKRRMTVLPGCTGLWQVSGRSEVGFDDMVLLDLYYIDNISPWFDLQLMLKTIPVMVFGKGAL